MSFATKASEFEDSTSSLDRPHPRREGLRSRYPRILGDGDEIEPVAGQSVRMRLHEQPLLSSSLTTTSLQIAPLSADNSVNRM